MNKIRKRIAIFLDWFTPAYKAGGIITTVNNLLEHLKNDYDFYVITSDRDLGDTKPFENITRNEWLSKDDYHIIYLSPEKQKFSVYKKLVFEKKIDIIYINGIFSPKFSILPLLIAKKYSFKTVLAPRGMLGEGALKIKPLKKKFFITILKTSGILKNVIIQSSNKFESEDIRKALGIKIKIIEASDPPVVPTKLNKIRKNNSLKLVFYSRISPKKNLIFALEILKKLNTQKQIIFDIIGPVEDENYWNKCLSITESISNKNITITYKGQISPAETLNVLSNYHFLFLPTLHENFGHVIFEAFAAGCPVIISNNTPWKNLEEKDIGWDIPLTDEQKFVDVIEYCADLSQEKYDKLSENAFKFAKDFVQNSDLIEKTKKLFE